MSAVNLFPTKPDGGCTFADCGTQDTAWLSPDVGRRCAAHPPWLSAPRPWVALEAYLHALINERLDALLSEIRGA